MTDQLAERLHSTTDAQVWAEEFIDLWGDRASDIDLDLMITWFANAMGTVEINQTCIQAINQAIHRVRYWSAIQKPGIGNREFVQAIAKLEEAAMWFTRGLAITKGVFNPADLEREVA